MNQKLTVTRKQAEAVIAATFPEYAGRKIVVEFTTRVTFSDMNWSGGTKNTYAAINGDGRSARLTPAAPWCNPVEGKTVNMPENALLVEHSYFCGKDLGLRIYAHPSNLPKWLPSGK